MEPTQVEMDRWTERWRGVGAPWLARMVSRWHGYVWWSTGKEEWRGSLGPLCGDTPDWRDPLTRKAIEVLAEQAARRELVFDGGIFDAKPHWSVYIFEYRGQMLVDREITRLDAALAVLEIHRAGS